MRRGIRPYPLSLTLQAGVGAEELVDPYESKAIERLPEGKGYFYADAAYDSRRVLNTIVDRGYLPIVKPRKNRARGYGARIRDRR